MKSTDIFFYVAATAGSFVAASPSVHHRHQHKHAEKRSPNHVKVVNVPGPTIVAFELNGKLVEESEVCAGIESGKLKWANGDGPSDACSSVKAAAPAPAPAAPAPVAPVASSAPHVSSTSAIAPVEAYQKPSPQTYAQSQSSSSAKSISTPAPAPAPVPTTSAPAPASSPSYSGSSSSDSNTTPSSGEGLDKPFPDNEIDCSDFPSDYGPIDLSWLGFGGWSGVQYPTISGNLVTDIITAVKGGKNCTAGAMCSYACPPGYQKSQWPSTQGSTGQSVGGLQCNENNKLVKTNPELSEYLCIKGTGATQVQNTLGKNAAICRTDYPGTESETVPLNTQPQSTNPLTCPDSKTYYKHENNPTTAQYYINNAGVAVEDACTWGKDGTGQGNWAPSYLGVGQDPYGKTWLSISSTAQNNPTNYQPLDYTVEITGDGLSGKCRLQGGKYCSGDNYDDCNEEGCTVELMSGDAVYVLSESS